LNPREGYEVAHFSREAAKTADCQVGTGMIEEVLQRSLPRPPLRRFAGNYRTTH
jgi:hypothetical protein